MSIDRLFFSLLLFSSSLTLLACASRAAPAAAAAPVEVAAAPLTLEPTWLIGGWFARTGTTPFGPIPMAMEFRREADGSLRGHTPGDKADQYIDLHLHRGRDGRLWLQESAALPGVGVQSHLLAPTDDSTVDRLRFRHAERPEMLEVVLERRGEHLLLAVVLRGKPHVSFELERMP